MNNKCVLLLGNGFDIAHGFKTRYKDFYNDKIEELQIGAKNGNLLFQHILKNIKDDYWNNLEDGLYEYSKELTEKRRGDTQSAKQFESEFIELKKLLFDYLKNPHEDRMNNSGQIMNELYGEWKKLDCHVVTFNYTYIAAAYNADSFNHNSGLSFDSNFITYQHGQIINPNPLKANYYNDIVVGIDESQKVEPPHSFLYKTSQRISDVHQLMEKFQDSTVYIIFGCSMGNSDQFYFKNLFDDKEKNKRYIVYCYGDKERKKFKEIIREYTGGLDNFQDKHHNNDIRIIDSSNGPNAIQETKDYIDSIISDTSL